ncbi:hypothetical protein LB505_007716 [Fusarium chuoi]|nr:hypothetical protein LB505_007716 [Fusarium chuoi]
MVGETSRASSAWFPKKEDNLHDRGTVVPLCGMDMEMIMIKLFGRANLLRACFDKNKTMLRCILEQRNASYCERASIR